MRTQLIDYIIILASFLLLLLGIYDLYKLPALLYSLFPILPAIRLLLKRGRYDLIREVQLLCVIAFCLVSIIYTVLLLRLDRVVEEFLHRPFTFSVVFSAAILYTNHPKEREFLLKASKKQAILRLVGYYTPFFFLLLLSYAYNYQSSDPLYIGMVLISHLMFLPWIYYLIVIWRGKASRPGVDPLHLFVLCM